MTEYRCLKNKYSYRILKCGNDQNDLRPISKWHFLVNLKPKFLNEMVGIFEISRIDTTDVHAVMIITIRVSSISVGSSNLFPANVATI